MLSALLPSAKLMMAFTPPKLTSERRALVEV